MVAKSPSHASPGSVSRSQVSRGEMRSLADELLSGASASVSVSSATPPPSYRRISAPASSASITRDSIAGDSSIGSVASVASAASESTLTAADAKARLGRLQRDVERARAEEPQRPTAGLFKAACSTDLLFLIDTTGSMCSYINAAKDQVKSIVDDIKTSFLNESNVRVAVVGYKDHTDSPNVQFLDFTPSAEQVRQFLDRLDANGGGDLPEDVLGGVHRALNASWKQQTRCIIHIADAPPHGRSLHDLDAREDRYPNPGSEPHGLTYEPLLAQLIQLGVNYALLRINHYTNRMALAFAQVYAEAGADVKLLPSNTYSSQVNGSHSTDSSGLWSRASTKRADLQFEEMELGTTYSQLRHLVVKSVTQSVSRTAGRMSLALTRSGAAGGKAKKIPTGLTSIGEDEDSGASAREVHLEKGPPRWDTPGWLDKTLVAEGFCPDMVLQSATSLNDMMSSDENIKLSVAQLTIHARSKPFAEGAIRVASYARTAASTGKFVVKSFKEDGKIFAHLVEDMRIQALCKAFALEFNGLLKIEPPIDFVVTTCLRNTSRVGGSEDECLALEPFIDGKYIKYNNNCIFVKDDSPDDTFNRIAQAFSHFTFERSWGHLLVNDLQGVGHLLTDPSIQTLDRERFKLADTNLNTEGFKFFFVAHKCNSFCRDLELKSNRHMVISGKYEFRERWPTLEPTVCCSNKLCRRIVRLASTHESDKFPGHHWCDACWPQLTLSIISWVCMEPGPNHDFDVSRFFYESQGQPVPRRCPKHHKKDKTVSSAAVAGGSLWNKMKAGGSKRSIAGRSW